MANLQMLLENESLKKKEQKRTKEKKIKIAFKPVLSQFLLIIITITIT